MHAVLKESEINHALCISEVLSLELPSSKYTYQYMHRTKICISLGLKKISKVIEATGSTVEFTVLKRKENKTGSSVIILILVLEFYPI